MSQARPSCGAIGANSRATWRVVVSLYLLSLLSQPSGATAFFRTFQASDFEKALSLGVAGIAGIRSDSSSGDGVYKLRLGNVDLLELKLSPAANSQNRHAGISIAKFGFEWTGEVRAIGVFIPEALEPCGNGIMRPILTFEGSGPSAEGLQLSFCSHDEVIGLHASIIRQFGTRGDRQAKFASPDELYEREKRPPPPPISTRRNLELLELKDWRTGR